MAEDLLADAQGGAECLLALVEKAKIAQAVSKSVIGGRNGRMLLGAMDRCRIASDCSRGRAPGEVLGVEDLGQGVEGRGDVGMVLGAEDLVPDGRRPLEEVACTSQVALGMTDMGERVERGGDVGMVLSAMDLMPDGQRTIEEVARTSQVALGAGVLGPARGE